MPNFYETQEISKNVIFRVPSTLKCVSNCCKTAIDPWKSLFEESSSLINVPNNYKNEDMC